jgi:hypothetical protein
MLGKITRQHVEEQPDMIAGRISSSSRGRPFFRNSVFTSKKVVHVLHRDLEILEPEFERQAGGLIEAGQIDDFRVSMDPLSRCNIPRIHSASTVCYNLSRNRIDFLPVDPVATAA